MILDKVSRSPLLFRKLNEIAERFVGEHLEERTSFSTPDWLAPLPKCVSELHDILARWNEIVPRSDELAGEQDHIFPPPKWIHDEECVLVEENQGGFSLRLSLEQGKWVPHRFEGSEHQLIPSLSGYLVSFALQGPELAKLS